MTDQEKYIAGQKASGIEVGDTVRVARKFAKGDQGCDITYYETCHKIDTKGKVQEIDSDGYIRLHDYWHPWFTLEIVKKKDGSVPEMTMSEVETLTENIYSGDSNMKTQEIFSYVVTENVNVKDAKTGQIEKVTKKILDDGNLAAYDLENAKVQAMASFERDGVDIDEVEVLVRPFCG